MDSHRKFINLNTPIIYLIKCLSIIAYCTLVNPVFAVDKQDVVVFACYAKIVAEDYKSAFPLCMQAASQGNAIEQGRLGFMYDKGYGTPKDDKQAAYWYTKAAEQGHADAQFKVGFILYNGAGTPKDNVMAYVWWNIAAAQGHEYAKGTRGLIEEEMTPNQIAEAHKLSKEYYAKYVK
jgi:TPR repeat protein